MAGNYLVFPMECLNISQGYGGTTSHLPHNTGTPKDWPIDCAGKDTGRDWFLCPCDEVKVVRIYGVGGKGTNTVWLESTKKVIFADETVDYAAMQVTHPNDDDLKKLKVGQKFKRGERMFREGTDGATANHLHISVGKGKIKGTGWEQNTKGKWVLTTTGGAVKPEKAFYVDKKITGKVIKTQGISFEEKPKDVKVKYTVNANMLNVRSGPGKKYYITGSLKKGKKVTVSLIKENWGKIGENQWICLDYCGKV